MEICLKYFTYFDLVIARDNLLADCQPFFHKRGSARLAKDCVYKCEIKQNFLLMNYVDTVKIRESGNGYSDVGKVLYVVHHH